MLENESGEIWACHKAERLSRAVQGRRSPWLTSSLTLPVEPVDGWVFLLGDWGDLIEAGSLSSLCNISLFVPNA